MMIMMINLRNFFHLPNPVELGWSKYNALGSREFTPFQEGKTWEDWEEYVKDRYPIRFFLLKTLPRFFSPVKWKFEKMWYRLQCHILPSYKFHILDFRGVDPLSNYTHGYMDPCTIINLAAWAALRIHVEKEKPADPSSWFSAEEMNEEPYLGQKSIYDETMALYKWWTEGRSEEEKEERRLFEEMGRGQEAPLKRLKEGASEPNDEEIYRGSCDGWRKYRKWREEKEEEMFTRLIKIRNHLWT